MKKFIALIPTFWDSSVKQHILDLNDKDIILFICLYEAKQTALYTTGKKGKDLHNENIALITEWATTNGFKFFVETEPKYRCFTINGRELAQGTIRKMHTRPFTPVYVYDNKKKRNRETNEDKLRKRDELLRIASEQAEDRMRSQTNISNN